jgi:DNA-directed RNA polymerase subunit RPC12/RpoP
MGGRTRSFQVIDTLLNLLFRCRHRRLTRPVAPVTKAGQPHSQSYVVCLDCGKQFEYDLNEMRMGKAIDRSLDVGVVPPRTPMPPTTKAKYAVLAAVPVALVMGAVLKAKKSEPRKARTGDAPDAPKESDGNRPRHDRDLPT